MNSQFSYMKAVYRIGFAKHPRRGAAPVLIEAKEQWQD